MSKVPLDNNSDNTSKQKSDSKNNDLFSSDNSLSQHDNLTDNNELPRNTSRDSDDRRLTFEKENEKETRLSPAYMSQTTKKSQEEISNKSNINSSTDVKRHYENTKIKSSRSSYDNKLLVKNKPSTDNGTKCFYYQLAQENLNVIFDWGIICPSSYVHEQKTKFDIQDKFKNLILLSDNKLYYEDSRSQILIELFLTQDEYPSRTNVEDLFFYEKPIPISRITKIIFSDDVYWDKLNSQVQNGSINFIPFHIGEYIPDIAYKSVLEISSSFIPKDYSKKLSDYDRRLGALSFMKNADLYYGYYSNYSKHYLDMLHVLAPETFTIKKHKDKHDILARIMGFLGGNDIINRIYSGENISKNFIDSLLEKRLKESENDVYNLLKSSFSLPSYSMCKNKYIEVLSRQDLTPYFRLAFLGIYADRSPSSTSPAQLKYDFSKEVKNSEDADILLAYLGLYYGYKFLPPLDIIEQKSDNKLSAFIPKNPNIKFRLNSHLDYLTIEAIYQISFNEGFRQDPAMILSKIPSKKNSKY